MSANKNASPNFSDQPIMNVKWLQVDSLKGNHYNPNVVFTPELKLLEYSIVKSGWIQPILISRDNVIIDGFHRWSLSKESKLIRDKFAGHVPCVVMDIPVWEAIMMTVRINRAKGTHVAIRMADIVQNLVDEHHLDEQQIAQGIGATLEEVRLLLQDNVFKARKLDDYRYSKAWIPKETRIDGNLKSSPEWE